MNNNIIFIAKIKYNMLICNKVDRNFHKVEGGGWLDLLNLL